MKVKHNSLIKLIILCFKIYLHQYNILQNKLIILLILFKFKNQIYLIINKFNSKNKIKKNNLKI